MRQVGREQMSSTEASNVWRMPLVPFLVEYTAMTKIPSRF